MSRHMHGLGLVAVTVSKMKSPWPNTSCPARLLRQLCLPIDMAASVGHLQRRHSSLHPTSTPPPGLVNDSEMQPPVQLEQSEEQAEQPNRRAKKQTTYYRPRDKESLATPGYVITRGEDGRWLAIYWLHGAPTDDGYFWDEVRALRSLAAAANRGETVREHLHEPVDPSQSYLDVDR